MLLLSIKLKSFAVLCCAVLCNKKPKVRDTSSTYIRLKDQLRDEQGVKCAGFKQGTGTRFLSPVSLRSGECTGFKPGTSQTGV